MKITKDTVIKILNTIYDNAVAGLPGTLSIEEEVKKEKTKYHKKNYFIKVMVGHKAREAKDKNSMSKT